MNFLHINNRKNFIIKEIPTINPASRKYLTFWEEQTRRCIDGFWSIDETGINVDISQEKPEFPQSSNWRYMPPVCYFYVNFGTILVKKRGAASGAKIPSRPNLDDVEWEFNYNWMEARGFSGFEFDEEYSCNIFLLHELTDDELIQRCLDRNGDRIDYLYNNFFKKNGDRKKYIPVREYIRRLFPKNMGRAIYANVPSNLMLLGTRDGGKSWLSASVISHEILFDGIRMYEKHPSEIPVAEVVVGAAISDKSRELLKKAVFIMDSLPGKYNKGSKYEVPCPFYKTMTGSIGANKDYTHSYKKKVGGEMKDVGTGALIKHRIFTTENPEAAVGGRPGTIVVEEIGLCQNLISIHGGNVAAQNDSGEKFGSSLYVGCVCAGAKVRKNNGEVINVEELELKDGIYGWDGQKSVPQRINYINPPREKPCYRITCEGNNIIECSEDHPLLMSKSKWDKQIDWKSYRNTTFKRANEIKVGDQLGMSNLIDKFGDLENPHSRLIGLMIGDGTYRFKNTPEISAPDEEIFDFITQNYDAKENISKRFLMTNGKYYKHLTIRNSANIFQESRIDGQSGVNKRLPYNIHEYSENSLCELIGGYWDADGHILVRKNGQLKISITSISIILLQELKFQLNRLGISSSIYLEKKAGISEWENHSEWLSKNGYVLHIVRNKDILTFCKKIKLLIKHKQNLLNEYDYKLKKNSESKKQLRYVECDIDGREYFNGMIDLNGVTFRTVNNIEYIGMRPVYNLNASDTHTYLANDFITGNTAGNVEKIRDAELIFGAPAGFQMLEFDNIWEPEVQEKICWFIPAPYMARNFKDSNGNTDIVAATKYFERRRLEASRSPSKKAFEMEKMNYPLVPSEMFVNADSNIFPTSDIKHHYSRIMSSKKILDLSYKVEFIIKEDGKIDFKNIKKEPIREYPVKATESSDISGCIEIFAMPVLDGEGNVPANVYCGGYDPIDDDDNTDVTRSLQSFWIMNRLTGELCLEYTGRTQYVAEFYEQVRRALIYYNARCNYENNKKGFFGHLYNKASLYLLVETPEILLQKDVQKSRGMGNKSLGTNANVDVITLGLDYILQWLTEPAQNHPDGVMNLHTIKSPALLREFLSFKPSGNFDRISALVMLFILREDKRRIVVDLKKRINRTLDDPFFTDRYSNNKY